MLKKMMVGVLAIGICLFAFNQYQQYRLAREQQIIEAQIKAEHDKIIENLQKQQKEPIAPPRRGIY